MRPSPSARPPLFSPRQLALSKRLTAFALRFWPLWSVWLLIGALPVSREVFGLHFLGSPLVSLYDQPWRKSFGRGQEFDGFRAAKTQPRDLNARLWRFSLMMQGLGEDFDQKSYNSQYLLREAEAIGRAFPSEKWLVVLPVRVVASRMEQLFEGGRNNRPLLAMARTRQLMPAVQKAARLEPNNAFYPFVEAQLWRETHNQTAMWEALKRASGCREFDAHTGEIAHRTVAAHEAIRPLILEEKEGLWREHNHAPLEANYWDRNTGNWVSYFAKVAHASRKQGDHRRVIEIGAMMARIGDLMQRGKNTTGTARVGNNWKNAVWNFAPRSKAQQRALRRRGGGYQTQSSAFARYAASHGRKDVAALVPKWAARQRELRYLDNSNYGVARLLPRDALWRAGWWRDAGALVGMHLLFVAAFWLVANLFLWRAVGAPSTSRARALPAFFWVILAAALAWWTWLQFESYDPSVWNMAQVFRQIAAGSVGVFAFFAAPFALALWCAATTISKHKSRFSQPTRLQTELRLYPVESGLLKAGATTLCALAIAATFALWAAYLLLVLRGTRSFDLTAWLPDAANGATLSFPLPTEALFAPLFYCLLLDAICFVLWFAKWRWFGGRENRAVTHGGLRFWKESLGLYVVFASLIYLGTTLAAWPSRVAAHRELELRLTRGELPAAIPK